MKVSINSNAIELSPDSTFIEISNVKKLTLKNNTFVGFSNMETEGRGTVISLRGDTLESALLEDLKFLESSVRFLSVFGLSATAGEKSVTLRNLDFQDLHFGDRFSTVIETSSFLMTNPEIAFSFEDLTFENITFIKFGELIKIKH